ncbi:glycoside hydrolase family 3 C-terminal domain-containing protein [Pseudoflavonifractor phocaeensis]|uniref:glycoside hydrolase family 3 C-terminal domain-containing protein n=1 Tax=Pseudoflavonifractor phocaeensis TaxID=1870988 RepID=UPI0021099E9C|nr:glycoside hydrolase family 3 C-terminal domain-containing protein [Pseudoflavonifractor phocaeensis]MCQ4862689.1 glycoside hydrolase family 3 C-terminal domain-containing protein [Pseudoflavonifractor phocaeensis]
MKYAELISRLTLEEKAALLSGKGNFTSKEIKRLGIPGITFSDGPHGLRKQAGAADHLGLNPSLPATCYPTAAAVANSWDVALGEALGEHLGIECVAQRVNMLLGPGLNIKRSPLCGRAFEYFSEDPILAGKMAAAYIRGIQSKGVSACPKHFAANSQETLRMSSDSVVDERTLREIYLTAFEIAVKEGRPKAIMSAYNKINGVYANEDKHLLRDILRDEWGFDGMVVTDWGGSDDHVAGVKAGSHIEMPAPGPCSDLLLVEAVRNGELEETVLDERLDEYLNVVFSITIAEDAPTEFDTEAHHEFAKKVAAESIVLLKNEDGILPLPHGARVGLIGNFVRKPRYQGAGSSIVNPTKLDTALECLNACPEIEVVASYEPDFLQSDGKPTEIDTINMKLLARNVEVVLLFLGLTEDAESEGMDRRHMALKRNQLDLFRKIFSVNHNVVVILSGGSAMELPFADQCKAIVHGYLGGQAGAAAMTDVLLGRVTPSGKLAESWPVRYEDTPAFRYFPGAEKTSEYREGPFIGYRYYDTAKIPVRFPFGFGLSYTTFAYSDLRVTENGATFSIKNTGKVPGAEIAQVYVGKRDGKIFRPTKELKGFTKVFLNPGEEKTLTVPLDDKAFRYFNVKTGKWEFEEGAYEVYVAASSEDIKLTGAVEVVGTDAPDPYKGFSLPSYRAGTVADVPAEEFAVLLGRPIPKAKWDRARPLERNDTISQLCYAKSRAARFVFRRIEAMKRKSDVSGKPDLNIYAIYNMPFRGIAKLMGPMVDLNMVDSILEIVNGRFWGGLIHLISAWRRKGKAEKAFERALADAGKEKG